MTSADLRVLIVDDDFMVAGIHTKFVERTDGFCVVGVAATGSVALAEVQRLRPDLVLLDVHLPDITGLEVLRTLRADNDATGVIMITAAREADTVRAAVAGGAAHYLVKPFEYDDLRARLEAFAETHAVLTEGPRGQHDIDAVFATPVGARSPSLPKGLSEQTATAVAGVLAELAAAREDISATECGERVGISRVSARRYLEHFVARGTAEVRLQYGAGRPERRYRSRG